jgi:hypothetical protein
MKYKFFADAYGKAKGKKKEKSSYTTEQDQSPEAKAARKKARELRRRGK